MHASCADDDFEMALVLYSGVRARCVGRGIGVLGDEMKENRRKKHQRKKGKEQKKEGRHPARV